MILSKETRDSNKRMPTAQMPVTRRQFLKRLGVLSGGLVVYISFGDPQTWAQAPNDFNAFLKIGADGRVACFTGKVEIGQGAITAISQTIADELDVPYDSIDMVMGDTDLCPWDRGTHGSRTIRYFVPLLRDAAAEARAVLIELASENLKTPISQLIVKDGVIHDKTKREKQITYAELTKGKLIEKHLKKKPPIKATAELRLMGKSFLSRDTLEKVTGKAKYAGDIRLSGMLHAKILRPPAHGAKLKHVDTSEAKKTMDVIVIQDNELISVLHKHPDEAEKALEKIKVE